MATNAFLGGITFARKDTGVSPNVYRSIEEVIDLPNFGETAPLVKATHFASTAQEYIAGLADGDEFTLQCNRTHISPSQQDVLIANKGNTLTFRITHKRTNVSPNATKTYDFDSVVLGWSIGPSIEDRGSISFTLKISGGVTIT